MNKTKLEDLVPPPEECRAAYAAGVIGDDTALVWFMWEQKSGDVYGKLVPREMKDEFARVLPALMAVLRKDIPAPTLAELLAMLPIQSEHSLNLRPQCAYDVDSKKFCAGYQFRGAISPVEVDQNPAAAALRLLVRVKNGEVK